MPSRRSRSRSYSRDRSRSPERHYDLPSNAQPIRESDYFQKSNEFRLWLKEEKKKYFDELSGEKARSYFRKFMKAWNRGKLTTNYYQGVDPLAMTATEQTGYKWSFASNKSRADEDALRAAREEVGAATHRKSSLFIGSGSSPSGSGRVQGPTLPSAADLTLAQELTSDFRDKERVHQRKRDKAETKNRIEEMVGPREVGREGMLEKKNVRRESDRAFREKGDDGLEADESTLLGGGDSFRDQVARRDASRRKYDKKAEGKNNELRERANVFKEKEKATMDMFQQLAKQRFG